MFQQKNSCEQLTHLVEDDSYAVFRVTAGAPSDCDAYYHCSVVRAPFITHETLGVGWLFPRRSQFYSMFNHYHTSIVEAGTAERARAPYFDIGIGYRKEQLCTNYDGKPIGMKKIISLFGIILIGVILSMVVLM